MGTLAIKVSPESSVKNLFKIPKYQPDKIVKIYLNIAVLLSAKFRVCVLSKGPLDTWH